MEAETSSSLLDNLPNELVIAILSKLPAGDVARNLYQTGRRLRHFVTANQKKMALLPTHCHAAVMDAEERPGFQPYITYTFTAFDETAPGYAKSLRYCSNGNDLRFKALLVQISRFGGLSFTLARQNSARELEIAGQERLDEFTGKTLLSRMCIVAARYDVQKCGKKSSFRLYDDTLCHVLDFCQQLCGDVKIKSLYLASANPRFTWDWSPRSKEKFQTLTSLESLTTEGLPAFDVITQQSMYGMSKLSYLQLRLNHGHREEFANRMIWLPDNNFLSYFSDLALHKLDVDLYSLGDVVITSIGAKEMCYFIKAWRKMVQPWKIKKIIFNTSTAISEFRTTATQMGLHRTDALQDIPYCRFRTHHPSDPNMALELICYGGVSSTKWKMISGYLESPIRRRN
ncbi:unnamed protein product, partial [Mesorhabditis spiculigera]